MSTLQRRLLCGKVALAASWLTISVVWTLLVVVSLAAGRPLPFNSPNETWTELDEYVRKPDAVFGWVNSHYNFSFDGQYTAHLFNLTSQTYLNSTLTSRSIWTHTMVYLIPANVNRSCDTAYLWLTWGSNGHPWRGGNNTENDLDIAIISQVAINTGCPAIAVYDIPNQEICFYDDPAQPYCNSEDDAIAYTFNRFLYHNFSADWLLLFPMTKAGIRAMDAVEEISSQVFQQPISHFIVSGASKRGWTTWLVGAVDYKPPRVIAIVPFVLDALNFGHFIHRQWMSYHGFSFVLKPYAKFGLTSATAMPRFSNWSVAIDPFFYRERLTMPKFALNAVGDEFQLLDDQAHWEHQMPGEMKSILIQNADHILITNMDLVLRSVVGYCQTVIFDVPRPSYTWAIDNVTGQIWLETSEPPLSVSLLQTTILTTSRDFRDVVFHEDPCIIPALGGCVRFLWWTSSPAVALNQTTFVTNVTVPAVGWTGFYLEMTFASRVGRQQQQPLDPMIFATPASVLPLGFPYADCYGSGCNETIV